MPSALQRMMESWSQYFSPGVQVAGKSDVLESAVSGRTTSTSVSIAASGRESEGTSLPSVSICLGVSGVPELSTPE